MNNISKIMRFFFLASLIAAMLCSCSSQNDNKESTNPSSKTESTTEDYSYKKRMDTAMVNAANPKKLAKVNNEVITQVDLNLYSIGGTEYDIDDVINTYVAADYAMKLGLQLSGRDKEVYDDMENTIRSESELTEDYCTQTYGVSTNKVIEYAKNRFYKVCMRSEYDKIIFDEIYSGTTPTKYPELKKAYENFKNNKSGKGYDPYDKMEDAYYEMIKKDYNIVIY